MNSIQESYLKALRPTTAIKIESLDNKPVNAVIKLIHSTLSYKYNTFFDEDNKVIYVGKKV